MICAIFLWWFVVVRGGLRLFAVVCLIVIPGTRYSSSLL